MTDVQEESARSYAIQMHIHGPGSEGRASMLAQDHMAAKTGAVDVIWWTEHDWRLANFSKVRSFSFDHEVEMVPFPARVAENDQPPVLVSVGWEPNDLTSQLSGCTVGLSSEQSYDGESALRVAASSNGSEQTSRRCTLTVKNYRACFPLFSRPRVKLAIFPDMDHEQEGEVFIEFVLSEQPPDLQQAKLRYVWSSRITQPVLEGLTLTLPLTLEPRQWNAVELNPADDAAGLNLPAHGLDNALHLIQVGATARQGEVVAYFDALELEPLHYGNTLLEAQRDLAQQLPMQVKHFIGMEISWYGQHMNAFGPRVPIPDYFTLEPAALSTRDIVEHVHGFDGLACYNHPSVDDPYELANELIRENAYSADLIEVAHNIGNYLTERLRLWDLLSQEGVLLTGLGVSDAHHASHRWENTEARCAWVTHIWANGLEEDTLLAALKAGRAYFADPSQFRGTLDILGPDKLCMGGAMIRPRRCELTASVTGARSGDSIVWVCNGEVARIDELQDATGVSSWKVPEGDAKVQAVRFELRREDPTSTSAGSIAIACSNPVYLAHSSQALRPQDQHRLTSSAATSG